uniref:Uncharacterized protein n=1 Tax=Leersia perrieri TaxID=77586 RepID=A0A0D9W3R7_9ORYZ
MSLTCGTVDRLPQCRRRRGLSAKPLPHPGVAGRRLFASFPSPPPLLQSRREVHAGRTVAERKCTMQTAATMAAKKLVLLMAVVVVLQVVVSGVFTAAAARTLPGEDWLVGPEDGGGVVRTVVEMLVGSKSGGSGGTHCC